MAASESRKIQGLEDPLPLTTSCLPHETEEDAGKEIPMQSAETHRYAEGTKVILKGLSTVQHNGQAGKNSAPVRSGNTGQDSSGFEQREQDERVQI